MLHLVQPSVEFKQTYLEALAEFQAEGCYTDVVVQQQNFVQYVDDLLQQATNPPEPLVPATIFWVVDEAGYIGRIDIRHWLTPNLRRFGGHIGYDIRPSRRREGNGTYALKLALPEARALGLQHVMITCDTTNIGSRKIIEANGGILEDIIENDFRGVLTMRWWIVLSPNQPGDDIV